MAHRGASDLAPENGRSAFALALEHGADLIETDLWFTADGEIVCHHDATLGRMTGDPRRVEHCSLRQIQGLRLRRETSEFTDDRVPSLAELLEIVGESTPLLLELKDPSFRRPERLRRLLAILGDRVEAQQVGILSDAADLLSAIREQAPHLVAGHIAMANPFGNRTTDLVGPYWPWLQLNPWYVNIAHRRGQRVCPLDPDLHRRLPAYLRMDVDAVLTNDPRATRTRIEELRGSSPGGR